VPAKLKQLHESGAHVVIFTNQAGIEKGHSTASQIQTKIGVCAEGA
jgi:histidinol phosphatase-like enzyme